MGRSQKILTKSHTGRPFHVTTGRGTPPFQEVQDLLKSRTVLTLKTYESEELLKIQKINK
jgi:hypothetical protein